MALEWRRIGFKPVKHEAGKYTIARTDVGQRANYALYYGAKRLGVFNDLRLAKAHAEEHEKKNQIPA